MTYPKPLARDEPRRRAIWICRMHGELEPGVRVCPECPPAAVQPFDWGDE